MNEKTYCNIMNRIRKLARENGEANSSDVPVTVKLLGGDTFRAELGNIQREDGYIYAYTDKDTYCFAPFENILSVEV